MTKLEIYLETYNLTKRELAFKILSVLNGEKLSDELVEVVMEIIDDTISGFKKRLDDIDNFDVKYHEGIKCQYETNISWRDMLYHKLVEKKSLMGKINGVSKRSIFSSAVDYVTDVLCIEHEKEKKNLLNSKNFLQKNI